MKEIDFKEDLYQLADWVLANNPPANIAEAARRILNELNLDESSDNADSD